MTTKTITAFVDHPSKWETTWTVTPFGKIHGNSRFVEFTLRVKRIDKKIAVKVTDTTESPYTIRKNVQIAEFSVVSPEQPRCIRSVDMAILNMSPEGYLDLTTYLNELLRPNKPEQQNNTIWFPRPENPGKNEDHIPIQTRILKEMDESEDKEKLDPTDNAE